MFTPSDKGGRLLDVQFEYSRQLWPWSGYLALFIRVGKGGAQFEGPASGKVRPHAQWGGRGIRGAGPHGGARGGGGGGGGGRGEAALRFVRSRYFFP